MKTKSFELEQELKTLKNNYYYIYIDYLSAHELPLALQLAAENGHLEVVKYLIEKKEADIHAVDDYALRLAEENGHFNVVKYLKKRK